MKSWLNLLLGILIGLTAAAGIILFLGPPRGEPIILPDTPTQAPLVVYVAGSVARPGLVALPPGSRVSDALLEAGGALPMSNLSSINLARLLEDGEEIYLPAAGEISPKTSAEHSPLPTTPLDLNTATADQLDDLPGIGPEKAASIVTDRELNGPFSTVEDIQRVSGIGPVLYERIQSMIVVNP